ncbi:MAG: hypothetical protein AABY89_12950 [Acidobacteriota bacterium]
MDLLGRLLHYFQGSNLTLTTRAESPAGAVAAKVCGAGGGGCLCCFCPPEAQTRVGEALTTGGARVLDYQIETDGLRIES